MATDEKCHFIVTVQTQCIDIVQRRKQVYLYFTSYKPEFTFPEFAPEKTISLRALEIELPSLVKCIRLYHQCTEGSIRLWKNWLYTAASPF